MFLINNHSRDFRYQKISSSETRKVVMWANEGAVPCSVPMTVPVTGFGALEPYRKLSKWPIAARGPLEAIYGSNQLKRQWLDYLEAKRMGVIQKNIAGSNILSRINENLDPRSKHTKLLLMRAPGRENTEDWLTYTLSTLEQARIINWMNQETMQTEEFHYCWGPHRANPRKFQTFTETFLCHEESLQDKY